MLKMSLQLDSLSREIVRKAEEFARSWEFEWTGIFCLLVSLTEEGILEPLLAELGHGVLAPEESALLPGEIRSRVQALLEQRAKMPEPNPAELDTLLDEARQIALQAQETEVRATHLAQALISRALQLGPETIGVSESLLLRRLLLGERLAGAPPAGHAAQSIDLNDYRIRPEVLDILPGKLCRQYRILPLKRTGDTLYVACSEPESFTGYEDVSFWSGTRVELVRVTRASLEDAMARHLADDSKVPELGAAGQGTAEAGMLLDSELLEDAQGLDSSNVVSSFDRFQKLQELSPEDERYFGIRGDLFRRIHYLKEAASSYSRAAQICEERGEWPRAVAYLRKLQDVQPSDRAIYRRLALCFRAMGMNGELVDAFGTFADLAARADTFEEAVELYLKLSGSTRQEPRLQEFLGEDAEHSYPSYRELVSAFMMLLQLQLGEPKGQDLYYLHVKLGLCYSSFGFDEEALHHYEKAVKECAVKGHPLWTVGVRYLWDGNWGQATDLFLLALDDPALTLRDRLHIEYDLALAVEHKGETERAHQLVSEIAKVNPDFLATRRALLRLESRLGLN